MFKPGWGLLRSSYRFLKFEVLYGTLLYRYGVSRHQKLIHGTTRSQSHTYTRFYRSPGQLAALIGPVLDHLGPERDRGKLQINVFASSNGAECYTLASTLLSCCPDLDFQITGSDLHEEMVTQARTASYTFDEVYYWATPKAFVSQTFDKVDDAYVVKPQIRARVNFKQANLLDPALADQFEPADLVFVQNVLCHLNPAAATQAFRSVIPLLKPRSALFVDGFDLDLREQLTRQAGLEPLDFQCRDIHETARTHVGERWWNYYYGMEPYAAWHRDRTRRFSTIFLQGEPVRHRGPTTMSLRSNPVAHTEVLRTLVAYFATQPGNGFARPEDALLSNRLADDEAIVDLLGFIEREFSIELQDTDLVPRNFESLRTIAQLVTGHRQADDRQAMGPHLQEE